MPNELHKVLIIARLDDSRQAAYKISTQLTEYGYSTDIAHSPPEKDDDGHVVGPESNIKPDLYLNKNIDISIYNGIVFLDDGGDPKACKALAKRANEEAMAIGGYAFGVEILSLAGLMKDKYVPVNLPAEWAKGGKPVNAPSVRSDNLVFSAGKCAAGFVALMVDALGGQVRKQVESSERDAIPIAQAALVISPIQKWADYWTLAEKLADRHATLLIADWNDVNLEAKTVNRCIAVGPQIEENVAFIDRPCFIPTNVWLRQATTASADIVNALEAIGCVNVNSSDSIRLAENKMEVAKIVGNQVFDDSTIEAAAETLTLNGSWLVKSATTNRNPMLVHARGDSTLVSKRAGVNTTHQIVDKQALVKVLRKSLNRDAFIINQNHKIPFAGKFFDIAVTCNKTSDSSLGGWRPVEITASSEGMVCCGVRFLKLACPNNWDAMAREAISASRKTCESFEKLTKSAKLSQLEISMGFLDGVPVVNDINTFPKIAEETQFVKLAQGYGLNAPAPEPPADHSDMADAFRISPDEEQWYKKVERELVCQGISIQRDGRIAISDAEGIDVKTIPEAVTILKSDIRFFLKKFEKADDGSFEARMYSRLVRNSVLKVRLLQEIHLMNMLTRKVLASMQKSADMSFDYEGDEYNYNEGTVPGPNSNVNVPARVLPWHEGDDWLNDMEELDEPTIQALDRYHPSSKDGFSAEFDLWHQNDPTSWDDVEHGQGDYPMRAPLMQG